MASDRKIGNKRAGTNRPIPEHVDPELTPPPMEPPTAEALETMDLNDQVKALHDSLDDQSRALGRLWEVRNYGDRLDRIDAKQDIATREMSEVGALIREFLMPAVKASQARIDLLLSHHEANRVRVELFYDREWPAAVKALEGVTERLRRVEQGQDRQEHEVRGMSDRLNASHVSLAARVSAVETFEARIALLERHRRDEEVETKALVKSERRKTGAAAGAVAAVVSAVAALTSHLIK